MITGLKEKSYTKEEFVSMSSDHTDHPKQRLDVYKRQVQNCIAFLLV